MSDSKNFVDFDFEIRQAQKLIDSIEKQSYNIQRKAMATGGRYIAQQVRRSYTNFFSNPQDIMTNQVCLEERGMNLRT